MTSAGDQLIPHVLRWFPRQVVVPVGECIITQGDSGDKFYVIESGFAQVKNEMASMGA
jgi:CRP-like cAMP-binding protein